MEIISVTSTMGRLNLLAKCLRTVVRQTRLPDLVLINLDRNVFEDAGAVFDRLPSDFDRDLFRVNLVEDVGPHTKLLPALDLLTSDADRVVTIDDDILYAETFFERIIAAANAAPDAIICGRARCITRNVFGGYKVYLAWPNVDVPMRGRALLPLGYSGVLYRRSLLDLELIDRVDLVALAPKADDLVFRILSLSCGTEVVVDPMIFAGCLEIEHGQGLMAHNLGEPPVVGAMQQARPTRLLLRGLRYFGWMGSQNDRQWRRLVSRVRVRV